MDSQLQKRIHDATLEARALLVGEARDLLQGIYGLDDRGRFEPIDKLPAVQASDEVGETRRRLETLVADERRAGLPAERAVDKLVKEVAFTHLNRLVAFKMLEGRRLIRGTLDRYQDSNAFKFYLADPDHADVLARYDARDQSPDALNETPRDDAYRRFLIWQSAQIAREVKVLFDPENLASRLFPRPRALRQIVDLLNDADLSGAWAPGNEETIGWVYQYFNEDEKAEVFDRLNRRKMKIRTEDVPAATQLFTPRWIVRFLVQNTLGRLWLDMHPDSPLRSSLDYLVPCEGRSSGARPRPVREITLLDPACGTMHFGLVAFDLLVEMYREELQNAGCAGWPSKPSVESEDQIAAAIIAYNLHGIDIDLRAVQLSALTLYLKAKSLNRSTVIRKSNLACADVLLLNGERLDAFLKESGLTQPIYVRLVRALWARLRDARVAGSLLRVEVEIAELIQQERERYEREGRQLDLFGITASRFEEAAASEEFWGILEGQLIQAFDEFGRSQAAHGADESYFVGEAAKGLRLLDLALARYDLVVANPPYMYRRNMNADLAEFLKRNYPKSQGDLYTAFIDRSAEFLEQGGRLGLITQQSFMFISSSEELRKSLLAAHAIETECHVGPHAFEEIGGEKVNTSLYVIRKEGDAAIRKDSIGTYFRLVHEPDAEAKRTRFEAALANLKAGRADHAVFHYRQGDFDAIPSSPWVYWITPGIRDLFRTLPKLGDIAPPRQGLATADNVRFLRFWWEVGKGKVGFSYLNAREALASGRKWFPYMKGGSFRRWRGNEQYTVNWASDGKEIKNFGVTGGRIASRPQNTNFYFRRGVTYSYLTSGTFSARLSPGGFIFDVAGSSLFPDDASLVLAVLNSCFAAFALGTLNPTVNFQVGDLARLPVPNRSSDTLSHLIDEAITLARADSAEDETTYEFLAPPNWTTWDIEMQSRAERHAEVDRAIDEEVFRLYGIGDADRAEIERELAAKENRGAISAGNDEEGGDGGEEIAPEQILSPDEVARRWVSYAVGIVLGRFQPGVAGALGSAIEPNDTGTPRHCFALDVEVSLRGLAVANSIATLDSEDSTDLATRTERALDLMLGEEEAARVIDVACGVGDSPTAALRRFLARDFFRWHVKRYSNRPIYWLFQSRKRTFGFYLWHERATRDTLPLVQGNQYFGGKQNRLAQALADLRPRTVNADATTRRQIERALEPIETDLAELDEFLRTLRAVGEVLDDRGEVVGWAPEVDDGVLINLAPLASAIPAWSAEPRKCWDRLAAGEYDWSFTARRYWPNRVLAKSKTNRSYAIAHGV